MYSTGNPVKNFSRANFSVENSEIVIPRISTNINLKRDSAEKFMS